MPWASAVLLAAATLPATAASPVALLSTAPSTMTPAGLPPRAAARLRAPLPLWFEPNRGQAPDGVDFVSRGPGHHLFLAPDGATLVSPGGADRVRMGLAGANRQVRVVGERLLPGKVHYLRGNAPDKWVRDLPRYAAVRVEQVYPGIDLVYYGSDQQLEYDFVVAPGADPRQIGLEFEGVEDVQVEASGDLVLRTPRGELRQHCPVMYQQVPGGKRRVAGGFVVDASPNAARAGHTASVRFRVGAHDAASPLIIDPVLSYAGVIGGALTDNVWDLAVDPQGCAYVSGTTDSLDFPVTNAAATDFQGATNNGPKKTRDVFLCKLDPTGSNLVYATYLGGNQDDVAFALTADRDGNVTLTGATASPDFPVTAGAWQTTIAGVPEPWTQVYRYDAFVVRLSASGSDLVYSTFLGGDMDDQGLGLTVDGTGNTFVIGRTVSTNFAWNLNRAPEKPVAFGPRGRVDGFLAKLDPAGSRPEYFAFLGGSYDDYPQTVGADAAGRAVVAGITTSTNFNQRTNLPVPPGFSTHYAGGAGFDAFAMQVGPAGKEVLYSTYLGGASDDQVLRLAMNSAGQAVLTGYTASTNFPTTANALQSVLGDPTGTAETQSRNRDAFVTVLAQDGQSLVYSSYLGGGNTDVAWDIALDAANQIYLTGQTFSTNFPVTANALSVAQGGWLQLTNRGFGDAFVTVLAADGQHLVYSSYLGDSGADTGYGIEVDAAGSIYVAGSTSYRLFAPWPPTSTNVLSSGNINLFAARLAPDPELHLTAAPDGLTVSWPAALPGYRLESAESLSSPTAWTPVDSPVLTSNWLNSVTLAPSPARLLLRLRGPAE